MIMNGPPAIYCWNRETKPGPGIPPPGTKFGFKYKSVIFKRMTIRLL